MPRLTLLLPLLLLALLLAAIDLVAARHLCFSGSSLYQELTVDCDSQYPGYNGTWYCAKIEVCEFDISSQRKCIVTRGCATQEQCVDNGAMYNGQALTVNNQLPAGMTIKPTCCRASSFTDDDAIAVNYNEICNSSSRLGKGGLFLALAIGVVSFFLFV